MAESDVSICSRSLVLLGERPISALSENLICATAYPGLIRGIAAKAPWRFMMKKAVLTKDAVDPIGAWKNSFILPGDMRGTPRAAFQSASDVTPFHEFIMFQRRLFTNAETVVLDYPAEIVEAEWPAWYVDLIVAALCANIAFPVTDQQNVSDHWQQKAFGYPSDNGTGGAMGEAMAIDAQQSGNIGIENGAFADARFSW